MTQQNAGPILGSELRDGALDGAAQLPGLEFLEGSLALISHLEGRGFDLFRCRGVRRPVERQGVQLAAPQVIDRRVVGDLEDPAGELVLRPVGSDRVQCLDEGFLREVFRQFADRAPCEAPARRPGARSCRINSR